MTNWHMMETDEVSQELEASPSQGLTGETASRRFLEYGPNELEERGIRGPWVILWEQLTASMVLILIAAAIISLLLDDIKDAVAIIAIVILNTLLGFQQEFKAEKALAAVKALAVPGVTAPAKAQQLVKLPATSLGFSIV